MNTYELVVDTNFRLITGEVLDDQSKADIVSQLRSARSTPEDAERFHKAMRCPGNIDKKGRRMYPEFYIPPYNDGRKLKTLFGQQAGTHILSANMYELEILRLLFVLAPYDLNELRMIQHTLKRLKTTCFGGDGCWTGECFEAGLVALRFLATVEHLEINWMQKLLKVYQDHFNDKKRPRALEWYFWLCLDELFSVIGDPLIEQHQQRMLDTFNTLKKSGWRNEDERKAKTMLLCTLCRNLSRFPDYNHLNIWCNLHRSLRSELSNECGDTGYYRPRGI